MFTVANIGDKEEAVALNLAYAGGVVELPAFPLLPGQSQTVNLRRDLARTLQGAGKALPEGAVFGGYQVRSVEDPLRAELVVKEHVLSASKKTAAPFYGSCNYVTSIWLSGESWPTTNVPLGGTKNVSPMCTFNTGSNVGDYGATLSPDGGVEISISPTYGYTRTINGLKVGTRNMLMSSDVPAPNCSTVLAQASPAPAQVTAPTLTCTPSVTRGQSANVSISSVGTASVKWDFLDNGSVSVTKNGGTTWNGVMVKSGAIRATVTPQGGTPHVIQCSIAVTDRTTGFTFSAVSAQRQSSAVSCGSAGITLSLPSPPSDSGDAVGMFCLSQGFTYNYATIGSGGPNAGYKYVTSATNSGGGFSTFYYYRISPDLENSSSAFSLAQCGNYSSSTGTGFISRSNLLTNTIQHESNATIQSHYANYRTAQSSSSNNLGTVAEMQVGLPLTSQPQFELSVDNLLDQKRQEILALTQVEPCLINENASCVFQGPINFPPYAACP